jgi:anti-sigma factor RsiW
MTDHRRTIGDIDLLAYADGLLDTDPERKAAVAAYLRKHPAEAAKVRDYIEQNHAIRRLYDPVLAEAVPERLWAVLERAPQKTPGQVARTMIAASLLLAAGFVGWMLGQHGQPEPWAVQDFVKQAMTTYGRSALMSDADSALQKAMQSPGWLSEQIAMPVQAPDLTPQGFTLVEKQLLTAYGPQIAQVTYTDPDGRRLSLFLRTRWQEEAPQLRFVDNEDITMVYWLEGPLVYALVGKLDRQEMAVMVQALRRSMHHQPADTGAQMNTRMVPEVIQTAPEITTIGNP